MLVLSILAKVTFIFATSIKNTTRKLNAEEVARKNVLWFSEQLIWNNSNENIVNLERCLSVKLKPSDFFSFASIIYQAVF